MNKIKIFVSHRIDQDSLTVGNPIYVPVKCGSVFCTQTPKGFERDDQGDNISPKNRQYCELTVQYWAWKNEQSDYYGLCHYRRYLSFSDKEFPGDVNYHDQVIERRASSYTFDKYGLLDQKKLEAEIEKYDLIVPYAWDVRLFDGPKGKEKTVYDMWKAHEGILIQEGSLDKLISVIKELYPSYVQATNKFLNGVMARGFNCFVMKRHFFNELNEFEFGVLSELEKRIDLTLEGETINRTFGFLGEILFAIYVTRVQIEGSGKVCEKQLVLFNETDANPVIENEGDCPIVVTCSDFYIPYLSTFIESLHSVVDKSKKYIIVVLHKAITKYNQNVIHRQCQKYKNIEVLFYKPFEELSGVTFFTANAVEESNYRLLTPWILKDYSKAVVIDLDVVFKRDVADLLNETTFDDNTLLYASKDLVYQGLLNGVDPDAMRYTLEVMKMKKPYDYVNTGVMVFNLVGMRKFTTRERLLEFSKHNHFRIQEQDLINVFYEGRIGFLDLRWNFYLETNSWVTLCINKAPLKEGIQYWEAMKEPFILHYANVPKPWDAPGSKASDEFWKLARETPYYEVMLHRLISRVATSASVPTPRQHWINYLFPVGSSRRKFIAKCLPPGSFLRKIISKLFGMS